MARIIISDDDRVSLLVLKNIVDFLGHEAVPCSNGEEALDEFKKSPSDLVLLDVRMPVMNGIEACKRIRQMPGGASVPIIMVSGLDDEKNVLEGFDAGANDYLLKPVKDSHLLAKLKIFLRMSSLHNSDFELAKRHAVFAGKYKIVKLLGYGAHSVVFLSEDISKENQKTALKLFKQSNDTIEIYDAFAQTAEKIKDIQCPFLLKTYDFGQSDKRLFVAMEYAEKGDMSKMLKSKTLSQTEALQMGIQIASAIDEIARKGVVHFDIKPQNIMIGHDDKFLLADFGIASPKSNLTMSLKKEVWGSPAYMPPEYLSGEEIFPGSSDIYSLGITLYESLTGSNPFYSDRAVNSMISQINLLPPELSLIDGRFHCKLSMLLSQMLLKDPSLRPHPAKIIDSFNIIFDEIKNDPAKEFCFYAHKRLSVEDQGGAFKDGGEAHVEDSFEQEPHKFRFPKKTEKEETDDVKFPTVKISRKSIQSFDLLSFLPHFNFNIPVLSVFSKGNIIKIVASILILLLAIFATTKIRKIITNKKSDEDQYIPLTVLKCEKCGYLIEKRSKSPEHEICPKCSSRMGTAFECENCRIIFPVANVDMDSVREKDLSPYVCPKCNSENTSAVLTSEEYLKSRSIIKSVQED